MSTLPDKKWTVAECELGNDLRHRRCHLEVRCDHAGGCYYRGHFCKCEFFKVVPAEPSPAMMTLVEIKALRMALRWGVPDPEPPEVASARRKLEAAQTAKEADRLES